MLSKRTRIKLCSGVFLLLLVGTAFFAAYSASRPTPPLAAQEHSSDTKISPAFFSDPVGFVDFHEGFFLVIATLVLALFTWRLELRTRDLFQAGERQLLITQQAVDAARDTARATLESGRAHIRADRAVISFVAINEMIEGQLEQGFFFRTEVEFTIFNWGQTPGVAEKIKVHLFRSPIGEWPDVPQYKDVPEAEATTFLAPNSSDVVTFEMKIEISRDDIQDFAQERRALILYGFIDYRDVWGIERRSGFALRLRLQHFATRTDLSRSQGPAAYWHSN